MYGTYKIIRAKGELHGLALFVRSLVGMEREAAKEALAGFLSGKTFGANQIEFVNLIVNHLTEHGVMEAATLDALRVAVHRSYATGTRWFVQRSANRSTYSRA